MAFISCSAVAAAIFAAALSLFARRCRLLRPVRRRGAWFWRRRWPAPARRGRIFMTPSTITRSPGFKPGVDDPVRRRPTRRPPPAAARPCFARSPSSPTCPSDPRARHAAERDRARIRRARQHDAHELAGTQLLRGIGQFGARLAGAGLRIDAYIGEVELAGGGRDVPSASFTVTSKRLSFGSVRRPSAASSASLRCSDSEMPKIT